MWFELIYYRNMWFFVCKAITLIHKALWGQTNKHGNEEINDITSSLVGPSSRHGLTDFKQIELLNEILYDNSNGEYSSGKDQYT